MNKVLRRETVPFDQEISAQETGRPVDRRELRKHRIAERLALGDTRERAERYADAVDAWLRRLDAEEAMADRAANNS